MHFQISIRSQEKYNEEVDNEIKINIRIDVMLLLKIFHISLVSATN